VLLLAREDVRRQPTLNSPQHPLLLRLQVSLLLAADHRHSTIAPDHRACLSRVCWRARISQIPPRSARIRNISRIKHTCAQSSAASALHHRTMSMTATTTTTVVHRLPAMAQTHPLSSLENDGSCWTCVARHIYCDKGLPGI